VSEELLFAKISNVIANRTFPEMSRDQFIEPAFYGFDKSNPYRSPQKGEEFPRQYPLPLGERKKVRGKMC